MRYTLWYKSKHAEGHWYPTVRLQDDYLFQEYDSFDCFIFALKDFLTCNPSVFQANSDRRYRIVRNDDPYSIYLWEDFLNNIFSISSISEIET